MGHRNIYLYICVCVCVRVRMRIIYNPFQGDALVDAMISWISPYRS